MAEQLRDEIRAGPRDAGAVQHLGYAPGGQQHRDVQTVYHLRPHGSTGVSPQLRFVQAAGSLRHL